MNPYARVYRFTAPPDRFVRSACEDVRCEAWQFGWETITDEATELGRAQAAYIRRESGRTFTEHRTADGLTVFLFSSRQRCFAEHQTRPQRFGVYDGGPLVRRHVSSIDWLEDCGEHLGKIAAQQERG